MSLELATYLMQLPTVRHLLDLIQNDLRHGRSVLGLFPDGIDAGWIRTALWDGLEHWHLQIREIPISQLDVQAPAAALGQALGVNWGASTTPRTVENLLKQADLPEVLFVYGFDELADEDRDQWLRFMAHWAQVCQGRHSSDEHGAEIPPALCLLAQASQVPYPPPQTNVLLSIWVWKGIPTTLEMRLLCRLASEHDNAPLSRWKEHTIPAIVGSDIDLADHLWAQEYRDGAELADLLRAFGEERGWEQAELADWPIKDLPREAESSVNGWPLPPDLYQPWAQGLVHWTPEYGLERHSSVLALLNLQDALYHRLWRGQAGFLLPEIDEIRLLLCKHLNQTYGMNWPHQWREPESHLECQEVKETPFACQWGHLEFLLLKCPDIRVEQRWLSLVHQSRQLRNAVAHYRPINLRDYEKFCRAVEQAIAAGLKTGL